MSQNALFKKLENFLQVIHNLGVRYPKVVFTTIISLTIIFLYLGKDLQFLISLDDIVNDDFSSARDLKKLQEHYKEQNDIWILVKKKDQSNFTPNELCSLREWTARQLSYNHDISEGFSSFDIRKTEILKDDRKIHFPRVFGNDCRESIKSDKDVKEAFSELRKGPWKDIITTKNYNDITISLYLNVPEKINQLGQFDPNAYLNIKKHFEENILQKFSGLEATWSGMGSFQHYAFSALSESTMFNVSICLALFILMKLLFGSFRSSLLLLLTLLITLFWLYGLMGILNYPVELLSNNIFLMLLISTIEDFIFLSYLSSKNSNNWKESYKTLLLPSFFTSVTTFVGFISLTSSNLEIIQRFGILAALGSIIEWVAIFVFLPAFIQTFPKFQNWTSSTPDWISEGSKKLGSIIIPKKIVYLLFIIFPISIYSVNNLNIKDSPEETFPKGHPFTETYKVLKDSRGIASVSNIVFEPHTKQEKIDKVLNYIKSRNYIQTVESSKEILSYLVKDTPQELRSGLKDDIKGTSIFARYFSEEGHQRSIVYFKKSNIEYLNELRVDINKLCPEKQCWMASTSSSYAEFGDNIRATLMESLLICLVLISTLIFLLAIIMKFPYPFKLLSTAIWGPAAMIVVIATFKIPIYFISCLFGATLVGLTGDNSIQYMMKSKDNEIAKSLDELGGASQLVTLVMIVFSLCFLFSPFRAPRTLGVLLAIGFAVSVVGDFWFFKSLTQKRNDS